MFSAASHHLRASYRYLPESIDQVPWESLVAGGEEPLFPFGFGLES